jgi:Arsenical resistance operon protein ArsD
MSVTIRVFDPAMCCSTGICGPSVDPELARFAADVDWLQKQGVLVERFNLSQQPAVFAETPAVREALGRGTEVLPLVLVGERIAVEGAYPSRETLAALAGVVVKKNEPTKLETAPAASGGCCTPNDSAKSKTGCC